MHRLGDFEEGFLYVHQQQGGNAARRWYWIQVFRTVPPLIINTINFGVVMLSNYLKVALRGMLKHRGFTVINVTGLALGLACFVMMMLYVQNELSYDKFHHNSDQIFRVIRHYEGEDGYPEAWIGGTPAPLSKQMKLDFPEVTEITVIGEVTGILRVDGQNLTEAGFFADKGFFDIFGFEWIQGSMTESLNRPYSMIMTESLAQKCFGQNDPLGQLIRFNKQVNFTRLGSESEIYDLEVTGIMADPPSASHLKFSYLISMPTVSSVSGDPTHLENWGRSDFYNYVKLQKDVAHTDLHERLAEYSPRFRGTDPGKYILQPLEEIHWSANLMDDVPGNVTSSKKTLFLFITIASFILIIACINTMNLTTARFSQRTKEIGLRKVVGARKNQIVRQFLSESMLFVIVASFLALGLINLTLPGFTHVVQRHLNINSVLNPQNIMFGIALVILTAFFSGLYPAFILTSFRPVNILSQMKYSTKKGMFLRNSLVVLQFAVSITLIGGTAIVSKQLRFIRNKDVGYNREHVVVIPLRDDLARESVDLLSQRLRSNPSILAVAGSDFVPLEKNNVRTINTSNAQGESVKITAFASVVGYEFFDVFGLKLSAGRFFSPDFETDGDAVIINEKIAEMAGWENPIGQAVGSGRRVIGVVKDFTQTSLHDEISPMQFYLSPDNATYLSVRISPENIPSTITFLKSVVEAYSPDFPFEYYFQDDYFNSKYQSDERFGQTFTYGSTIAILIACMGIFGLAVYTSQRRIKEFAVRKVLGASGRHILSEIGGEFMILVGLANILAWPVIYFFMKDWLENFSYKTNLNLGEFLFAAMFAFVVAFLVVGFQSIRVNRENPVETLKCE